MRVLLIAYDFPPSPSPQSLRWAYLVRELDALGHEICVITVDLPGYGPGGLPDIPDSVRIHRVYPGLFTALLLRKQRRAQNQSVNAANGTKDIHVGMSGLRISGVGPAGHALNWKGRLAERLKGIVSLLIFPDYRAEWFPWARRTLRETLGAFQPDIVVTSHEPACSLSPGLEAKRLGYRWIADLGDPVLATYTPSRWRWRAKRLERRVCRQADLVSVTSHATARLLIERHGIALERCFVLPQGFDAGFRDEAPCSTVSFDRETLELLYTGSFYSFRKADALLGAVTRVPGVRLSIAASITPDYLRTAAAAHPDSVRLLGFVPHRSALSLQRRCDVLVNLANADPVQVPGKVNEYLGAGRPILHVSAGGQDATGELIRTMRMGWQVGATSEEIEAGLRQIRKLKAQGAMACTDRDLEAIAAYSWQRLAADWCRHAGSLLPIGQCSIGIRG